VDVAVARIAPLKGRLGKGRSAGKPPFNSGREMGFAAHNRFLSTDGFRWR
jgi:hypothetical protein